MRKIGTVIFLLVLFCSPNGWCEGIRLAWTPNEEPDLAGYRLFRSKVSGNYTGITPAEIPKNQQYTDVDGIVHVFHDESDLTENETYYWVVLAYNTQNLESRFSNEVTYPAGRIAQPIDVDAGEDQSVLVGESITLHGTATHAYGDPIVLWEWTIEDAPPFGVNLHYEETPEPLFASDLPGDYVLSLVASDGTDWSEPDTVTIHVTGYLRVSPAIYDFGNVKVGSSSSAVFTNINVRSGNTVTISDISLELTGGPDFTITQAPLLPLTLAKDETADVEVTITPFTEGLQETELVITSYDPYTPTIQVPLGVTGVAVEPPPEEQVQMILEFFDESIAGGTLDDAGPGSSGEARRNALRDLRKRMEACGDLIAEGLIEEACQKLQDFYNRCYGDFPHFVVGEAADDLMEMVLGLMMSLNC